MIRINQCLLSSGRLLHVARDNGVGRHLPFVHQLLSNVETKMKIYAKIVCTCLKLRILGMIYSTIYWRRASLKSIKQTQYQWQFLINWWAQQCLLWIWRSQFVLSNSLIQHWSMHFLPLSMCWILLTSSSFIFIIYVYKELLFSVLCSVLLKCPTVSLHILNTLVYKTPKM